MKILLRGNVQEVRIYLGLRVLVVFILLLERECIFPGLCSGVILPGKVVCGGVVAVVLGVLGIAPRKGGFAVWLIVGIDHREINPSILFLVRISEDLAHVHLVVACVCVVLGVGFQAAKSVNILVEY